MEEELRYAPLSFRNPMMSKLRTYRKDLAKLHREVRSTPLTATPGGRGDMKYGTYAVENEHVVSVGCFPPFGPVVQESTRLRSMQFMLQCIPHSCFSRLVLFPASLPSPLGYLPLPFCLFAFQIMRKFRKLQRW